MKTSRRISNERREGESSNEEQRAQGESGEGEVEGVPKTLLTRSYSTSNNLRSADSCRLKISFFVYHSPGLLVSIFH